MKMPFNCTELKKSHFFLSDAIIQTIFVTFHFTYEIEKKISLILSIYLDPDYPVNSKCCTENFCKHLFSIQVTDGC